MSLPAPNKTPQPQGPEHSAGSLRWQVIRVPWLKYQRHGMVALQGQREGRELVAAELWLCASPCARASHVVLI